VGQPPAVGGSVAPAGLTDVLAVVARRGSRRPYHDTSAPTINSPAHTHIASWKAWIEAWFEAMTCWAVAPAAGGLSGWNIRRTALSLVSSPVVPFNDA
jgi:hypothetical protein